MLLHGVLLLCCSLPGASSFHSPLTLVAQPLSSSKGHILFPLGLASKDNDDDDDERKESINPNDFETPEERKARMEMVRKIQKSFYGKDDASLERTTATSSATCNTILENVPLWRVQWTELPGYQEMLNVHVAHYTHMFNAIMAGTKPWYFGHVFLPGGSENLDNPEYRLLKQDENDQNTTKATYTGVLMHISDAKQLEDGRLALVVQALERFQVLEATQHEPYAIAKVKLIPDAELAMPHYEAAQKMAQELSDDFLNDNDAWGAACAAALETAEQVREFEYRPVAISSSSMGAVAPLANYDMDIDVSKVFPADTSLAKEQKEKIADVMEKHLFSASPMEIPDNLEKLDVDKVMQLEYDVWLGVDSLVKLLHQLNPNPNEARMTPVPTQMLGLLPRGSCHQSGYIPWPGDFQLDQYANRLEDYAAAMTVGTYSKSPFVRYDFADNAMKQYPILRRAQRLSFVVWLLVENIGLLGDEKQQGPSRPLSRQEVLEIPTITQRLEAAKGRLDAINDALRLIANQS